LQFEYHSQTCEFMGKEEKMSQKCEKFLIEKKSFYFIFKYLYAAVAFHFSIMAELSTILLKLELQSNTVLYLQGK
jgi:hypothetical protein